MNGERQEKSSPSLVSEDRNIEGDFPNLKDFQAGDTSDSSMLNSERMSLIRQTRDQLKADALKNGWKAQARKEIDAFRHTEGREDYNATRRANYASAVLENTGHLPRHYGEPDGPEKRERRNEQFRESKKRTRALMTPEEKAKASKARAERRRKKREREQAEAAAALAERSIF